VSKPPVAATVDELIDMRAGLSDDVAVVMTMGALHEGHASLIRLARKQAADVIVTIFVNPLQFTPGEDLDRYPRSLLADLGLCGRERVRLVFAPSREELYPGGDPGVRISAGALGEVLEGEHRPGHFAGVLTVVAKLLHLTRPRVAVFGEKDGQQVALIRRMVADLDFGVRVLVGPTVRDSDGLALSSRNRYLSDRDREAAQSLNQALRAGQAAASNGPEAVLAAARETLSREPEVAVDYVALVDDETWRPADSSTLTGRLLVAGRIGNTRLIDNMGVDLGTRVG
jgi:pantoate--beta-alanine ligase